MTFTYVKVNMIIRVDFLRGSRHELHLSLCKLTTVHIQVGEGPWSKTSTNYAVKWTKLPKTTVCGDCKKKQQKTKDKDERKNECNLHINKLPWISLCPALKSNPA